MQGKNVGITSLGVFFLGAHTVALKPQGDSIVDSTIYSFKVDQMSIGNLWGLSG